MNRKIKGFTIVELLTVIVIISMLLGILLPSMAAVRKYARNTKQKAQLTTISLGLAAFRNEIGDYPDSFKNATESYYGAHKLAEALLGWDLLGYHPGLNSYRLNGDVADGGEYDADENVDTDNLSERRGPYLESGSANAFLIQDVFTTALATSYNTDRYVLCDNFKRREVTLANGKKVKAGRPILYFKANTSSKTIDTGSVQDRIYNFDDNQGMVDIANNGYDNLTTYPLDSRDDFYDHIYDPDVFSASGGKNWPYRPDSYLLISAGADGLYGNNDDITNFGD